MLSRELDRAVIAARERCRAELNAAVMEGRAAAGPAELVASARRYVDGSPEFSGTDDATREEAARFIVDDLFNLGPIEPLLADETVTEIMVNAPDDVRVERAGRIERTDARFFDDAHVASVITRIAEDDGRHCDVTSPLCDCTLHRSGASFDGSRVNAVWKGVAVDHPILDIRKFRRDVLTPDRLVEMGSMDERCRDLLEALVLARMNLLIVGGTGTGKTTLLNAMSSFIPDDQRIVTVEDTAELNLGKDQVIRLEARQASTEGTGEITIRQLVKNTLRMRPDRIVVGEVRGAEAFDMLQAMSTGHDGSMTTLHANDPKQAIARLQMCVQQSEAGAQMPPSAILRIISDAVDFIVHIRRFRDGSRRVAAISEVDGLQGPVVTMGKILDFQMLGVGDDGRIAGQLVPAGDRFSPDHLARFEMNGVAVDESWFGDDLEGGF